MLLALARKSLVSGINDLQDTILQRQGVWVQTSLLDGEGDNKRLDLDKHFTDSEGFDNESEGDERSTCSPRVFNCLFSVKTNVEDFSMR